MSTIGLGVVRRRALWRERYHRLVPEARVGDHADSLSLAFWRGEAQLDAVYAAHGSLVYGFCRRSLTDDRAAEVTQDVFVSAWRGRDSYDPARGGLAMWLVGIAKRRIIDHLRSEGRHASRRADESEPPPMETDKDLDQVADRMIVAHALRSLPDRPRQVIEMAYVHDLTHQEIADRTGLPLGTIKSDIRRGLQSLRSEIGGER
jgi:RNA polymerase sigma factor (sigma-70 family)